MGSTAKRVFSLFIASAWALTAVAGEIVYTPINPTFGGSPLNSSQLANEANAQKPNPPSPKTSSQQQSTSQQFLQMLQSQLYASLASSVSNAITGQNAQAAGTIKLNSMQVSWNTVGGQTNITLNDYSTGQITQISVPKVTQ